MSFKYIKYARLIILAKLIKSHDYRGTYGVQIDEETHNSKEGIIFLLGKWKEHGKIIMHKHEVYEEAHLQ